MKREEAALLLKPFLETLESVVAVWEAGSQATGRVDAYSDLDLLIITQDEEVEKTLQKTYEFLKKHLSIRHYIRAPEPTWHGFSQFFVIPDDQDLFYFDLSFTKVSQPDKFTDVERHGKATIWFEKTPLYSPTSFENEEKEKMLVRIKQSALLYAPIIERETRKACKRDSFMDAMSMYHTYLTRFLVPFINLLYRPNKADFGVRYLKNDIPHDVYQKNSTLFIAPSCNVISEKITEAVRWYEELKTLLNQ